MFFSTFVFTGISYPISVFENADQYTLKIHSEQFIFNPFIRVFAFDCHFNADKIAGFKECALGLDWKILNVYFYLF